MVRCFMEGMSVKEKITQGSCFLLTGALGWMSPELRRSSFESNVVHFELEFTGKEISNVIIIPKA